MNTRTKRTHYLDNLRIYLTILVIMHHAALAYGGTGGWSITDVVTDELSPILLTLFNALNQSYFMTAFFLLAGYFTPRSFEHKGTKNFLLDRFVRLGIPLLIYTTVGININNFLVSKYQLGIPFHLNFRYDAGHLWFVQVLLIFALLYTLFQRGESNNNAVDQDDFPSNRKIWITILTLSALTFLMRLIYPVGKTIIGIQPGHVVHYIFAFYIGTQAYHHGWFGKISNDIGKRWGYCALLTFPVLIAVMVLGGVLEDESKVDLFMGSFTWQAAAYAVWESIMMVSVIIFLLYFFREKLNHANALTIGMAASVYTVYIIHQTILYGLNIGFLSMGIPSYTKFFIVSLIGVTLSFLLSIPVRKLPYAERVLG
ncbi:MAG TPA: acyltransferase family protein [Anaerolineales bacterium]|nr:acyltransferase family protein [Anaerolineales bacterium]